MIKHQRRRETRTIISHPRSFQPTFSLTKKFRFQTTSAATTSVLIKDLGDLWCVAVNTTSAVQLAEYVRVRKIEMWGPMASSLSPVTVTIDWVGSTTAGTFGKSTRISDTSIGSSEPAHVKSRPPEDSQISEWLSAANTAVICSLTYPIGTIIDLTYDIVIRDDASTLIVTGAVAGATIGANYVRSLASSSTATLPPLAYATI